MKKIKTRVRITSCICVFILMCSMFFGCAKQSSSEDDVNTTETTESNADSKEATESEDEQSTNNTGFRKLTDETVTFSVWSKYSSSYITGLSESSVIQKVQEVANVELDFKHPPLGEEERNFNLMIASNNLPDLIWKGYTFPGGPDKAIKDGYYLALNEYIDNGYAPNYKVAMESNAEIKRQCMTDEGNIYAFQLIQLDKEPPWSGPIIRKDWLDEFGLEVPETIDEWENVLTTFKEKKDITAPLAITFNWRYQTNSAFASSFGGSIIGRDMEFFLKDGTDIVFGPTEPGFKDYLTVMNRWYEKGLLDPDFAIRDDKSFDALVSSGDAGAYIDGYASISKNITAGSETDPNYALVAAKMPVVNKGDQLHIRQSNPYVKTNSSSVITTECKDPEIAVQFLDMFYSEEGFYLFNYGTEGETYTLEDEAPADDITFFPPNLQDKKPVFTDFMLNNPDGTDFWVLIDKYKMHTYCGFLRNPLSYKLLPEVMDAMATWGEAKDDWILPTVVLTDDEARRYSSIMTEVKTYQEEIMFKMIMGLEPIENFDKYVAEIERLGIDEAIEIKKVAYERYLNR